MSWMLLLPTLLPFSCQHTCLPATVSSLQPPSQEINQPSPWDPRQWLIRDRLQKADPMPQGETTLQCFSLDVSLTYFHKFLLWVPWTSLGGTEFMHVCVIVFLLIRKIAGHFTEEVGTVGVVCLTSSSRHSPNHSHIPSSSGIHQETFPSQDLPASLSEWRCLPTTGECSATGRAD